MKAIAAFLVMLLFVQPAYAADRAEAEAALVNGVNAYRIGENGDARRLLHDAIEADETWAQPHAVLASIMLAGGDGVGGDAEAHKAMQLGMKPDQLNQLFAHAQLLQGNAQKALDLAQGSNVALRFQGYAARIRAKALWSLGDLGGAGREFDAAVSMIPRSADLWSDIGLFRQEVGNFTGALEATGNAVNLNRHRFESLKLMGGLVRAQFGLTAAIPWYQRALQLEPNNLDLMRELASTLGDAGQTVEMLKVTRHMLEVDPSNPHAFYLQAVLAARVHNYELARNLLYRAKDRLDTVPAVKLLKAALEMQLGSAEQAIALLQELVQEQPDNLKAQRLLGAALWQADDSASTIYALQKLADRPDADSYILTAIGRAYEAEGNIDQAAVYLDRASQPVRGDALAFDISGDPMRLLKANNGPSDNADIAVPYINKLVMAGASAQAFPLAERLRTQNPGAPAAHMLVGDVLMANGRAAEAVNAFRGAANIKFDEPIALRLIEASGKSNDAASALRVLDLYLSQNPRNVPGLLLAADHFVATGRWNQAIAVLEGLHQRLGDREATVLSSLGWAWFNKGDVAKALKYSGAAYALLPGNAAFADSYGWILYRSGTNKLGGAALLQKAVAIAPAHPGLRLHLGQALAGLGRTDEARIHLSIAANTADFPGASEAAKLLAGL
jgi:cellulose synthase operon protein C